MKKYFQYILMAVAVVVTASCSNELDEALQPANNGTLQFVVSDFPMFGEGTQTRVIGTQDEGKTAWENGDQIIVTLISQKYGEQAVALTYNGSSWSTEASLSYLENETPAVSAIYAPCYEVTEDGVMKLSDGMQLGMTEYIPADCSIANGAISISFADVTRKYSRLRLAGLANQTLTVTTTDFTPAGATEVATAAYTLTTDDNGNAFLYGTFAVGATVSVTQGDIEIRIHAFASATEECVSYAFDAMSPYIYDEATNTYTVYTAEGLYAWSEKVRAIFDTGVFNSAIDAYEYEEDFPNLTLAADIILTGENNWTPIGRMDEYGWALYYIGTINGGGHTITGLHISNNSIRQGFIGGLDEGGTVKNLTFADAHMTVGQYSGIVVGGSSGTIENCQVISGSLTTTGGYAGGIVGSNGGMVKNCTNAATITVAQGVTGIYNFGGIVGSNNGTVMGCINTGAISPGNSNTGGVVGKNNRVVVACSNKEAVTGSSKTGGIVGFSAQSYTQTIGSWTIVTNESDVESDGVGGKDFGTVTGCFTGDAATINDKVSEMNAAIATYNSSAAEGKTCPYIWQAGTDGYPTLVKSE